MISRPLRQVDVTRTIGRNTGVRSRSGSSRGGVFTGCYKWLVGGLRYQSYQSVVVSLLISSRADAISSGIRARA